MVRKYMKIMIPYKVIYILYDENVYRQKKIVYKEFNVKNQEFE